MGGCLILICRNNTNRFLWDIRWFSLIRPQQGGCFNHSGSDLYIWGYLILEPGNDVVRGSFYAKFMICDLVNGDHFSIMGEHHDSQ